MDEHKLTELLQSESGEVPARTRFCPDDEHITCYFEGALSESSHAALKRHLEDCRFCLARVGNLERLVEDPGSQMVPGEVLAEAKSLAQPDTTHRIRRPPMWAAAAILVVTVATIAILGPRLGKDPSGPPATAPPTAQNPRQVRNAEPLAITPRIISPVDGASISLNHLAIEWTQVRGSLYYDVRVVDAEGFIIRSDRIEGATEWTPPLSHLLESGQSYYVRVDAYLPGASSVSSDHVQFSVTEGGQ